MLLVVRVEVSLKGYVLASFTLDVEIVIDLLELLQVIIEGRADPF